MTKKILVVGSRHNQPGEDRNLTTYREYFQSAADEGIEVFSAMLDDLLFDISPGRFYVFDEANNCELSAYDLIIIRGMLREDIDVVYCVSEYAHIHAIPSVNDYGSTRSSSKLAQAFIFYREGLLFPRTIYASKDNLVKMVKEGRFRLPFIYKDKFGSHGSDNFLVHKLVDLDSIKSERMLAQEFIPNDCDYRVLIIGDKQLVIMRKSAGGSHLHNTSQGGTAELIEDFDKRTIDLSRSIAKKLGMHIAGVDVMMNKVTGEYLFLEINSQPQLKTGSFVENKKRLIREFLRQSPYQS